MNLKQQISDAIGAHALWKTRLRQAILSGKSELTPAAVHQDTSCTFGKWLVSADHVVSQSPNYQSCRKLHADFHAEAAKVMELALRGHKAEAERAMTDGEYAMTSNALTRAMMAWSEAAK